MSTALPRVVVWFSCGAASALAAKHAVIKYAERVTVVYCDTSASEHPDNLRFMADIERWIGKPITRLKSEKYTTVDEVFEARKYLAGIKGAPCTVELKKKPRFAFQRADDVHVFGFTAGEEKRIASFEANNPDMRVEWILRDLGVTKDDCFRSLYFARILPPVRYGQGFVNNNCAACVKATSLAYWVLTRRVDPEAFARRAEQSRRFGARLTRWKGKRIFLDEIPPDDQIPDRFLNKSEMENISCGPECAPVQLEVGGNK